MTVLAIPSSLTNTSWTAPAGTFTMPAAKTAVHGAVTVDLSACTLVDGGGTAGLLSVKTDCTSLHVVGGDYVTTSAMTSALIAIVDGTANCVVTLEGWASTDLGKLITGQGTDPSCKVYLIDVNSTGLAVGVEVLGSIDGLNSTLLGGGVSTSPVGIHGFQDAAQLLLWVPGTEVRLVGCTIKGFVSSATTGFRQGDPVLVESSIESVYIDNCDLGDCSDSGGGDFKVNWGEIKDSRINSLAGRAISSHTMGDGTGPWRGIYSHDNVIHVRNALTPSGGLCSAFQAEGVLVSTNDTVILHDPSNRLAVTAFDDAPGSGAAGSYPRLGDITLNNVSDANGTPLYGPLVRGDNATHKTSIVVNNTVATSFITVKANKTARFGFKATPAKLTLSQNAEVVLLSKPKNHFGFRPGKAVLDGPSTPINNISLKVKPKNRFGFRGPAVQRSEGLILAPAAGKRFGFKAPKRITMNRPLTDGGLYSVDPVTGVLKRFYAYENRDGSTDFPYRLEARIFDPVKGQWVATPDAFLLEVQ